MAPYSIPQYWNWNTRVSGLGLQFRNSASATRAQRTSLRSARGSPQRSHSQLLDYYLSISKSAIGPISTQFALGLLLQQVR